MAMKALLKPKNPLVWIDCEMTGLDIHKDVIIEICCIITDGNLLIVGPGYESTVYYDAEILGNMNPWCQQHHHKSGLVAKVLANPNNTLTKVQDDLLNYIRKYVDPAKGVLAGNSVHMDKFFMAKDMPKVIDYLHYRIVDVSSIMEICRRHNPTLLQCQPLKKNTHTARLDILESIAQLQWFQDHYLKTEKETTKNTQKQNTK